MSLESATGKLCEKLDELNKTLTSLNQSMNLYGSLLPTLDSMATAEPKAAEPKAAEPKAAEPKAAEPKAVEPKAAEPKAVEPTPPKAVEPTPPKEVEPTLVETPTSDDVKTLAQTMIQKGADRKKIKELVKTVGTTQTPNANLISELSPSSLAKVYEELTKGDFLTKVK